MNPEIKMKWLEALRSGKYRQGRSYLRRSDNTYCCLGVLCDLMNPDEWEIDREEDEEIGEEGRGRYFHLGSPFMPDLEILDKAALPKDGPNGAVNLSELNDSGSSFAEITDYIESHL